MFTFAYMHLIIGIMAIGAVPACWPETRKSPRPGAGTPGKLHWPLLKSPAGLAAAWPIRRAGSLAASRRLRGLGLNAWELLRPSCPFSRCCFLPPGPALEHVLPAARIAGMLAGALMVGNYPLMGLANLNDKLRPLMKLTPLEYNQGCLAVEGINGSWLAGFLLAALLFATGAWLLFLKRDIRVGGERGWQWPWFGLRRKV